jgi:hypothetical protein
MSLQSREIRCTDESVAVSFGSRFRVHSIAHRAVLISDPNNLDWVLRIELLKLGDGFVECRIGKLRASTVDLTGPIVGHTDKSDQEIDQLGKPMLLLQFSI